MTTTYDPHDPAYLDEADVRGELTRVFEQCASCRLCVDFCGVFPTLFDLLDARSAGGVVDAGRLTPAEQDRIVVACFGCTRCAQICPYTPDRDERAIDVPRLVLRTNAMRRRHRHVEPRMRWADDVAGRADLVGCIGSATASVTNRVIATPGSWPRRLLAVLTGVSAEPKLAPFARRRFSAWFQRRPPALGGRRARAAIVPTCQVEYRRPEIGHALVAVYERSGIECSLGPVRCCGAPLLAAGDLRRFAEVATRNARDLASIVADGADVVVADPTCGYVLRQHLADHVDPPARHAAELVAAHTFDAGEYLMRLHAGPDGSRFTEDRSAHLRRVVYHESWHLLAQAAAATGGDLLAAAGADVRVVQGGAASEFGWGRRAGHEQTAAAHAGHLAVTMVDAVADGPADEVVLASDSVAAAMAIEQRTGRAVTHPLQVLAEALGIAPER